MKRFLFIGVLVVAVVAVAAFFASRRTQAPPPAPAPTTTFNTWRGVTPGATSVNELTSLFGPPVSTAQNGEQKTLLYPSANQYWKNEIAAANGTVVFMRERLFSPTERSLEVLSGNISEKSTILYGPDFESGYVLYVYPEMGIAFYANASRKLVYEVWRFVPMTLRDFLSRPEASGFGLSPQREPE